MKTDGANTERAAPRIAAREREERRIADIDRRRDRSRRMVLGLEAVGRATAREEITARWAKTRWTQLQGWKQEACWNVLRPALGLAEGTFEELMRRHVQAVTAIREGKQARGDQQLLSARREWRKQRANSWLAIGEHVVKKARLDRATPAERVLRRVRPIEELPQQATSARVQAKPDRRTAESPRADGTTQLGS